MKDFELDYYEAGIKDANETRSIIFAYQSKRFKELCIKHKLGISNKAIKAINAYNKGVAFEINRQTKLEF